MIEYVIALHALMADAPINIVGRPVPFVTVQSKTFECGAYNASITVHQGEDHPYGTMTVGTRNDSRLVISLNDELSRYTRVDRIGAACDVDRVEVHIDGVNRQTGTVRSCSIRFNQDLERSDRCDVTE